jgi:ABC-2 type transport system permease protein
MICGTSLSYLIGTAVTNQEALSAVCNVVTLGPSFISGVFVPQELISQSVLRIASFTPSYWYVKANNEIAGLTSFGFEQLESVFSSILIQLGFAVAMFAVALVVAKRKRYA